VKGSARDTAHLYIALRPSAWLIRRGRMEDAKKAHRRLIGSMDDYDFDHEFNVLVQEVEYSQRLVEAQSKSEWRAVFQWRNFRRVLIPVLPYAGQTLNGGAYINSYTTYFFQQAGLKNAFLASVITSLLGSAGIGTAMLIYDRVGRRPLRVWGTIGCAIGNYIIAGLAFVPISPSVGAGLITVAAIWQFISSISYGAVGACVSQVHISRHQAGPLRWKSPRHCYEPRAPGLSPSSTALGRFCGTTPCRRCCRLKRQAGGRSAASSSAASQHYGSYLCICTIQRWVPATDSAT
jgi:hypothetical protein